MLPDRVSNPRPLTYESGALPIALRGPALKQGSGRLQKLHVGTPNYTDMYVNVKFSAFYCCCCVVVLRPR